MPKRKLAQAALNEKDDFLDDLEKERNQSRQEIISVVLSQEGLNKSFKERLIYSIEISSKHFEKAYLTIKVANSFNVSRDVISGIAYGAELLMISALIFDDVIDKAEVRSNKPSVWKKYGIGEAIILADYLTTLSYNLVIGKDSVKNSKILNSFIQARLHLLEGQFLIESYNKSLDVKILHIAKVAAELRCGHLIKFCFSASSILCGNDSKELKLAEIGIRIGQAMQIRDDIHDYKADIIGKPFLQDFMNGQPNIVTGYLARKLKIMSENEKKFLVKNWRQHLSELDKNKIKTISIKYEIINDAVKFLNNLCNGIIKDLSCLSDSFEKMMLIKFVTILKI